MVQLVAVFLPSYGLLVPSEPPTTLLLEYGITLHQQGVVVPPFHPLVPLAPQIWLNIRFTRRTIMLLEEHHAVLTVAMHGDVQNSRLYDLPL